MSSPHQRFGLTLMVNHACNLRCTYCYTGKKFNAPMARETGVAAITRAFHSLLPNGQLDLGFFGGEPLLESRRILEWMSFSRTQAIETGKRVRFNLTTNGTINHREAWQILMADDLDLAVSFDGIPTVHDRHRRDAQGNGSAVRVEAALRQLIQNGKDFHVVMVVRPDVLADAPDGLRYLHDLGVRVVAVSLDLWTTWTAADGLRLQNLVRRAADSRLLIPCFAPSGRGNRLDPKSGWVSRDTG
jgi:uncharacterized protein